ncbi:transposase [Flavobacterium sp.]|uniref:transposase n=1 Tax=Flavobacterium sp. TaxID=239 RepID=UPI001B567D99|nr:transposase [Flavobacterium sp.]MBP6182427.1 transposase [Flavobacterium sp.]
MSCFSYTKNKSKRSANQIERAYLLFQLYPDIQKAYGLTQDLRNIFEKTTDKIIGFAKLSKWHEKVNQSGFKSFNTISRTIILHYQTILNYFDNRSQILWRNHSMLRKAFRAKFRGVRNIEFYLFRLTNIYA